jgi:Membrane protein involved in the export of O-antigen and teichoic acid
LKKYLYYNLFAFGSGLIIFGLSVSIWFTSNVYNKLNFAVMAYLVTYGLMFIYGAALIFNERRKVKNRKKRQPFGGQFKVGFRGFISNLAALLLFRLDLFLVGYFLSLKEVGIYSIALFGAEMVTKIPGWSAAILTPMVASNEGGHVRRTVYLFYSAIIIALLLGLLFVLGIMAFPNFISNLAGKDFTSVEICLLLLLPRVIMQSGVGILAANLAGKGYPWYHPAGCTIPLIFLIFLDIILIPKLGINGAALGNSLAYVSAAIVFWIGFRKCNEVAEDVCLKTYWSTMRGYLHGRFSGH